MNLRNCELQTAGWFVGLPSYLDRWTSSYLDRWTALGPFAICSDTERRRGQGKLSQCWKVLAFCVVNCSEYFVSPLFFLSILGYWSTWSTNLRDWWKPLRSGEIDPAEKLLFLILFICIFIMVSFRSVSHANVSWNIILFQLFVAIYIGAIWDFPPKFSSDRP